MLRHALLAALLLLAPLSAAGSAAARHVCSPIEPAWLCEHREPTTQEILNPCRQPVVGPLAQAFLASLTALLAFVEDVTGIGVTVTC